MWTKFPTTLAKKWKSDRNNKIKTKWTKLNIVPFRKRFVIMYFWYYTHIKVKTFFAYDLDH